MGINLRRENTGLWAYLSCGAGNDGIVMVNTSGSLSFSLKPSKGTSSGTITDAAVNNNIKFRMNKSGVFETLNGDISARSGQNVSATIGAAYGGAGLSGTGYLGFNLSKDNVVTGTQWPYTSDGVRNGGDIIYGDLEGNLIFSVKPNTGASTGSLLDVDVMQNGKMMVTGNGKVVIGDHVIGGWGSGSLPGSIDYSSNNYKLFVEKGILTERVRIAVKGSVEWADYVFDKDYKLMPLKDLENYIATEKHLPEIPTTSQVMNEGVDVGQMQAKLLQKVEELTQYVIAQQKEIDELKKKNKH